MKNRFLAALAAFLVALGVLVIPASPASASGVQYLYAGGTVSGLPSTVNGARFNVSIEQPYLSNFDYHSLVEVAGMETIGGKRQIVEAGVHVCKVCNGDTKPRFFVYRQIDDVGQGYNANDSGWVDWNGGTIDAGADLSALVGTGTMKTISIVFSGNAWWVGYDNLWVGYWPLTDWDNAGRTGFDEFGDIDYYGEVALDGTAPDCTDMGDGSHGNTFVTPWNHASDPAVVSTARYLNSGVWTTPTLTSFVTDATKFSYQAIGTAGFAYGGPGFC